MAEEDFENTQNAEFVENDGTMVEYLHEDKITMQDLYNHMLGPGVSLIVHLIVLAILGTVVMAAPSQEKKDMVVEMTKVDVTPPPPPPPPPEQKQEEVVEEVVDVQIERPTASASNDISPAEVSSVSVAESSVMDVATDALAVKVNNSALQLPNVYSSRTAGGRKGAMKKYGGTPRGEQAVLKALRWLAKVQNEDGSWGDMQTESNKPQGVAVTSVATLCFLAHGETPSSEEFGKTVENALRRLCQYTDGMGSPTAMITGGGNGYSNAMAAYAISEGFAMTQIPMLERAMDKVIFCIVQGQNNLGGFDYNYAKKPAMPDPKTGSMANGWKMGDSRCDLSLGGWNYQALKAAYAAGCKVEGLESAIDKAVRCIENVNNGKDGSFTYINSHGDTNGTVSMTSVGTLCLQLMGAGRGRAAKSGMKWLENYKVDPNDERCILTMNWKKPPPGNMALYTWYYMTQAYFQGTNGAGKVWTKWNNSFQSTLIKEQHSEGYWLTPGDKYFSEDGMATKYPTESGLPGKEVTEKGNDGQVRKVRRGKGNFSDMGGKVWATGLCTLMLEVYYRMLPTFKVTDHGPAAASSDSESSGKEDELVF